MNVVRQLCQPGKRILLQDIFEEAKDVNELIYSLFGDFGIN